MWRCKECQTDVLLPSKQRQPVCPKWCGKTKALLQPLVKNGRIVAKLPEPKEIRDYLLEQLEHFSLDNASV